MIKPTFTFDNLLVVGCGHCVACQLLHVSLGVDNNSSRAVVTMLLRSSTQRAGCLCELPVETDVCCMGTAASD